MKTDGQIINFYRAVQHGKAIVIDASPEMLAALTEDDADIVNRINLLFDMMAEHRKRLLAARRAHNPEVVGSSPTPAIKHFLL